jgi:acetyl esterase/lipase
VRIYTPIDDNAPRPGIVWLHGGGFCAGDLDQPEADYVSRYVCAHAGAVVVSVDYRLAVEGVHYPVPLDDVVAALGWVRDNAADLGIDADRLSIGGASAGANLAAAAALRVRDDGERLPAALLLVYPLMHAEVPPSPPAARHAMAALPPVLRIPPDVVTAVCANYLGADVPASPDGYAFPGHADLRGLPPTLVLVSEYDDLRPSGELFAQTLAAAGVVVQLVVEPGVPHGHLDWPGLDGTTRSLVRLAAGVVAARR